MPFRILFVCYENICRSPMAEGAFRHLSDLHGVAGYFEAGSAGTVCYQSGSSPDPRALRAASRWGIDISGIRARCIHELDMSDYDHIFVMDHENYRDVTELLDGYARPQVRMVTEFADGFDGAGIEDPYYGAEAGFDRTLTVLAGCIQGILTHLVSEHAKEIQDQGEGIVQNFQCGDHGSAG